jgi:hypothetical protein
MFIIYNLLNKTDPKFSVLFAIYIYLSHKKKSNFCIFFVLAMKYQSSKLTDSDCLYEQVIL